MTDVSNYQLTDRYTAESGTVFLSGVQALARLPADQIHVDRANGLNTASFVSGYPGSPLGGFDQQVARMKALLSDLPIEHVPAVNEELGAVAVMGSQLAATRPDATYDGVVGVWYGKAPGVDRACDALRHGQFAGASQHGGVVVLVGDDPAAKSSTLPSSSDATLVDLHMPILYPGDVQEAVDLSRHAVALSRASGLWSAMKIVAAVADGTGTVDLALDRIKPVIPTMEVDGKVWVPHPNGNMLPPHSVAMEKEFREIRMVLAGQYARENRLNRTVVDSPDAWIGLIASGYTYRELRHALARLGLADDASIAAAGIRLLSMQMPVPFDPRTIREFARGLEEIVIVEEKNPTLEWLVKDALYGGPDMPVVVGKHHEDGRDLMRSWGILDADAMEGGLRERLARRAADRLVPERVEREAIDAGRRKLIPVSAARSPFFCSGCPHNTSTKVPEGTIVGAGIGCHGMVLLMDEDRVGEIVGITSMGGEGAQWIGMAPFVETDHLAQNLGDGTFFHSGQLAIQAAVAAGAHITYKLLYNGTVAMTGGQDAQGSMTVPEIATMLLAHGVTRVLITTDDVGDYKGVGLPKGVDVWNRSRIIEAQKALAAEPGVTVLIHDQVCAAEERRKRKRGLVERPPWRVVINDRICEGCGDCGDVSNCLSVQPVETAFGRKTRIDQTSCNFDYSCLQGDCPSFMTVEIDHDAPVAKKGGVLSKLRRAVGGDGALPDPVSALVDADDMAIRMAGIGGTGVVTVAQVLGTAAMLDGWKVRGLDQTGLSQKAGQVISDLRLSRGDAPASNLLGAGEADVLLAFDMLAGSSDASIAAASPLRTVAIGSTSATPTGAMISDPTIEYPDDAQLSARIDAVSRAEQNRWLDAGALSRGLLGSGASANIMVLGAAYQAGLVPVAVDALTRAIDLNGVAVEANLMAFDWGRRWIVDPDSVEAAAGMRDVAGDDEPDSGADVELPSSLVERVGALKADADVALLTADLIGYQDEELASGYLDTLDEVAAAERSVAPASTALVDAVAVNLHKLLAYKDEYEVARLILETGRDTARKVGGKGRVRFHLHPPMLKALGLDSKMKLDERAVVPMMKALAKGKRLRGSRLDPFGRMAMRRMERELPDEYRAAIGEVLSKLTPANLAEAVEIASLPDQVRGYEELKEQRAAIYRSELAMRLAAFV